MRNRLAGVLGRPGELKGLGAVEGGGSADLASLVRAYTLQDCLGSSASAVAGLCLAYRNSQSAKLRGSSLPGTDI